LKPCPIHQSWIIGGDPIARSNILSTSSDGSAITMLWDCTAGRFNWLYDSDETAYVIEGEVLVKQSDGGSRLVAAGDTIFFPAGSRAEWTVEQYVRKIAFVHAPAPAFLSLAGRLFRRFRNSMRSGAGADPGRISGSG
jgi:uncharacterized cupin superfamily protein